ncbi:hypothetical protein KAI58_03825 [Candidatus Gracilibacteria bacterium]|nr:hypothetical protein [Candidatus Gracilibacteria bacterium]
MEKIVSRLYEKFSKNLLSIYLYTPYEKKFLLLILKETSFSELETVKSLLKNIPIIILTSTDLEDGADVFSVEFLSFKYHTKFLKGKDLLKQLKINKKHVRQHLEYEMRNKLIYLRLEFLKQNFKKFLPLILPVFEGFLEGLLYLKDTKHIENLSVEEKIKSVSTLYDIDLSLLKLIQINDKRKLVKMSFQSIIQTINLQLELLIKKVNNL